MKTRLAIMVTAVILMVLSLTLAAVQAQEGGGASGVLQTKIAKSTGELDRIRQDIRNQKKMITSLDDQEAQVQRDHQDILKEIELIQQLLGEMDQRERLLQEQSSELLRTLKGSKHADNLYRFQVAGVRLQYLTSLFPDTRHLKPQLSDIMLSDKGL